MSVISHRYILLSGISLVIIITICSFGLQWRETGKFLHKPQGDINNRTANVKLDKAYKSHRKILVHGTCTIKDISISQSTYSTNGIPQFVVEIVNTCFSGCAPSNIHLHCDWFASARIVNPNTFKRLSYDDCLVNEGKPLKTSQMIRFTYSNTFKYPLAFKSAKFC
nr:protein TAPETUM DETERMINANT 1-like [Ipomoea batatas]GMD79141.1 protein TAPETUM DETERMINANT 1-like [Ipomoea batatas]GMD83783.1 protein TAPETUM DETERMINANT 1-like [Ipomoea batatas]